MLILYNGQNIQNWNGDYIRNFNMLNHWFRNVLGFHFWNLVTYVCLYVRGFPVFVSATESLPLLSCLCDKWTYLNMSHWPGVRKTSRAARSLFLTHIHINRYINIFLLTQTIFPPTILKQTERLLCTHRGKKAWWMVACNQNKAWRHGMITMRTWDDTRTHTEHPVTVSEHLNI